VGKVVFADMSQAASLGRQRLLHCSREQDAQHDGGTVVEGGGEVAKKQKGKWKQQLAGKRR